MLENPGAAEADRRIEIARRSGTAHLDLSWLHLDVIPDSLGQLSQLQTLFLFHNHDITAIPDSLAHLTQLRYLELSDNRITAIPDSLGQLSQLQFLNLADNQITDMPESLATLENLSHLLLHGNPNLGIPPEVLGPRSPDQRPKPPKEILAYYFAQRSGSKPLNEAKLILVGPWWRRQDLLGEDAHDRQIQAG